MALYRLGRASSILRGQLRSVNGLSGHLSRGSCVGSPLPSSDADQPRPSPLMMAEMLNGSRSLLKMQLGMRYFSTGEGTAAKDMPNATTQGDISQSAKLASLRPLSPHLPVYKPQMSSMLSITHRITTVYLTSVVLAYSVIFLQMGKISLTYFPFFQFCCYIGNLTPLSMELAALAVAYNIFHSFSKFGGRI